MHEHGVRGFGGDDGLGEALRRELPWLAPRELGNEQPKREVPVSKSDAKMVDASSCELPFSGLDALDDCFKEYRQDVYCENDKAGTFSLYRFN